jgi:hypothetical protein
MTLEDRSGKVEQAVASLPAALAKALADPDNKQLWADVEQLGAVVHRQSRLLAGKPRGG